MQLWSRQKGTKWNNCIFFFSPYPRLQSPRNHDVCQCLELTLWTSFSSDCSVSWKSKYSRGHKCRGFCFFSIYGDRIQKSSNISSYKARWKTREWFKTQFFMWQKVKKWYCTMKMKNRESSQNWWKTLGLQCVSMWLGQAFIWPMKIVPYWVLKRIL